MTPAAARRRSWLGHRRDSLLPQILRAEEGVVLMMRFPIDTSRLKFLVVAAGEELRQFEEGKPRDAWARRTDANGEVLWRVQVVALGDGDAEIIRVTVPGDPKVGQGEMVRVQDMTVQGWEMDGRSGMTYRAAAIRSEGRGQGAEKIAAAGGGS
jgi:hypothetical protein